MNSIKPVKNSGEACAGRRFSAVIALSLLLLTALVPLSRADTPTSAELNFIGETTLGFTWVLDNPLEEYPLVVISTVADFSVTIASATGELGLQTTTYADLAPNTPYYFKVKVSTEPDANYTAAIATATYIQQPIIIHFDAVSDSYITASAYSPAFSNLEAGSSGVNISIGGSYTLPWRNGNKWTAKTAMTAARSYMSAGVMDEKVYAVGGNNGSITGLNRAYNPALNTWASKVAMTTAREGFAVAVIGGKLYAVGGYEGGYLNNNEEYDPVSDAWTAKAVMSTPRSGLAAGAVGGQLFAVGGFNGTDALKINEQYDPAANSWTTKNPMPTFRYDLAAGVVEGKLYAVGGYDEGAALGDNAEYDPEANSWAPKTPMPTARSGLAAAVIGGKLYAVGGSDLSGRLTANEAYDPATNTWETKPAMTTAREKLAAGSVGGKLYAMGGSDGGLLATNEEYDPGVAQTFYGLTPNTQYTFNSKARNRISAETWYTADHSTYTMATVPGVPVFTAVSSYSVTVNWADNGNPGAVTLYRAQVSEEASFAVVAASSETYNLSATMSGFSPNTTYYARVAAINLAGAITNYTAPGSTMTRIETPSGVYFDEVSSRAITASAYGPVFTDITTGLAGVAVARDAGAYSAWRTGDTWAAKTAMPTSRMDFAAVALGGKIYAIGGLGLSGLLSQNEEYDPVANAWTARASMLTARDGLAAAAVGSTLYALGGSSGGELTTNEQYDPEANSWSSRTSMPTARTWLAAATGANGRIYAIGGSPNSVNEEYDPAANVWATRANMSAARFKAAAAAVGDKIYLIGGTLGSGELSKNEEYDTISNGWTLKTAMFTARQSPAAAVLGGNIYVVGGGPGPLSVNEEYNPVSDAWTAKTGMLTARQSLAAASVRGRLYALGGNVGSSFLGENEMYDPGVAVAYTGLTPNTQYAFTAKARNYMGTETPDSPTVSTYTLAAVPGAPAVAVLSSTTQRISWDANANPLPGTNYILKYSTSPDFPPAFTTPVPLSSTFTSITILTPNTSYYYDVLALNNAGVPSDFTGRTASSCTLAAMPGPLSIDARTTTSQDISWGSGGNPGPGTNYLLRYSTSAAFTPAVTTATLFSAAFAGVSGLLAGTSYYYDVAAVNKSGVSTGYTGSPVAGYTLPAAPGAPVPTILGTSSISWTWAAATGAESYRIYAASAPSSVVGTALTNIFIETGLTPNTSCGILVAAVDPAGESAKSAEASTYTYAAVPLNLSTGPVAPSYFSMDLNWGANGNPAGTVYSLDYWPAGGSTTTMLPSITTASVEGLTGSTSYYFMVRARNEAGFYGPAAGPLLMPTLTLAPAGLTAEPQSPTSIRWTWSALPTALRYDLYSSSSPTSLIGFSYSTVFLETGLSTNTPNGVYVVGVNLAGQGEVSVALDTFTYAAVPGAPVITASNDTSQAVSWNDRGNPAGTEYELRYSTSPDFLAGITTAAVTNSTSLVAGSLAPNTSYYYDVLAVNVAGRRTAYTGVPVSSYTLASVPGVPVIYAVGPVSQSVYWEANGNPAPDTRYRVRCSTSPGFEAAVTTYTTVTSTYTTIPNLTPNTSYFFDSAALNHIGVQSAFTGVPASSYTIAAVPGNPSVTAWSSTTHRVEWLSGGNPTPGTDYRVEYSTSGNFTTSVSSASMASSTFTTIGGLTPGTSYYYRVAAMNRTGGLSNFTGIPAASYTLAPPPDLLEAMVLGVSSISWTWSASTSALSYKLYSTSDLGTPIAAQPGLSFIQTGISTNTVSRLVVSAVNLPGEGPQSPFTESCTLASVPGAASVTDRSTTTQRVTWDANENPLLQISYVLRYSTHSDFSSAVLSTAVADSTWTVVTGLSPGTLYYYDVAAVNAHLVQTAFNGTPGPGYTLPETQAPPEPGEVGISSVVWTWAATQSATGYKVYTAAGSPLASVTASSFTETGLSSNTSYGVRVSALNPDGEGEMSAAVSTYTLAGVPGAPVVTSRTPSTHSLTWPENGNPLPGTSYRVRYSTSPDFIPASTTLISTTFTAVTGLTPNTSYFYGVAAVNNTGRQSAYTGAAVSSYTLAAVPATLFLVGQSSYSQTVSWNRNANPLPGTDYVVRYSTSADFMPSVTTMTVAQSTFTAIAGLSPNTSYYYDVAAITVDLERSAFYGFPVSGYTLSATPGAPVITARSSTTQSLEWDAGGNPDPGTAYRLRYSTSSDFTASVTTAAVLGSTFSVVTGLAAGTSYYYDVAAYNTPGMLTPFTGIPAAGYTLPAAVEAPAGAGAGPTSIQWTWAPVQGAAAYNVYAPTSTPVLIGTSGSASFLWTGLSTNTLNGLRVSAVNPNGGEGELSGPATAYTLSAAIVALSTGPDAATGASLTVQWGANTNPPGTLYDVQYWAAGGATTTVLTALASAPVAGLTPSTSYYFQVSARNDAGQLSAPVQLYFPTMPETPADLAGEATGAGSIVWTWTPVPTASSYRIYPATDTGTLLAVSASPYFLETGLSTNTQNGVVVSVVNLAGESPQSAAVSTYTLSAQPVALSTGPDAAATNAITLQWEANTNPPTTPYRVDYWAQGGSTSNFTTTLTSAAVTGLAEATSYYFWVRSANDSGALSAPASLTAPTLSGGSAWLFGTVLGTGSVRWLWNPVPTALSYRVYPASEPATVIFTTNTVVFVQTGLAPNFETSVLLAVVNAAGVSPQSSPDLPVYTHARPPAGETVTAVYASSASISWGLNGNPNNTEADVESSTDNFNYGNVLAAPYTDPAFTGSDPVTFTAPSLLACTTYYFRVYNRNASGIATVYSSTLTFFTTGAPPLPPGSLAAEALANNSIRLTWEPSPSGQVTLYTLYYDDATGTIDYGTPVAVVSSTVTTYTQTVLTAGAAYKFGLRASLCGTEEQNVTVLAAATAASALPGVRAAVKVPPAGKKIFGNRVTLVAELDNGTESQVSVVKFQYKSAASGTWSDVAPADAEHPNPDTEAPYLTHWDVSTFTAGGYDLRAVAKDQQNLADPAPPYINVQVSSTAPDINENLVAGVIWKEQKVYSAVSNAVQATDTGLVIPAGAISDSTATVTVINKPSNVPAAPASAQGCGVAAEITLSNGQTLLAAGKTAAVTLAFADDDNNGYLDDYPNVRTGNLQIYSYSALNGWRKDFSSSVDLSARTVTGNTPHFSFFALFAPLGTDLDLTEVYPVPFVPNDGNADNGVPYSAGNNNSGIIFDKLPAAVGIKIYTVTGQLVADFGSQASGGSLQWDVKNDSGADVASGGYVAVISSPGIKPVVKKILVIR